MDPRALKTGNLAIGSCMAKLLDIHCGSCGLREASKLEESSVARNILTSTGHKVKFLLVGATTNKSFEGSQVPTGFLREGAGTAMLAPFSFFSKEKVAWLQI